MADLHTIDVHAHILTEETIAMLQREVPSYRLQLRDVDGDFATLDMGAISYPKFPRGGWDLERRFRDMERRSSTARSCRSCRRRWPTTRSRPSRSPCRRSRTSTSRRW